MAKIELHPDFKEFLKLLNSNGVEYLVVGGYAVSHYGYPRATADIDIWIELSEQNADKISLTFREFGAAAEEVTPDVFMAPGKNIRMGVPPVRLEVLTGVSGVNFSDCYPRRVVVEIENVKVNFISLDDLKVNKRAAARPKDLEDLDHLP